MPFAIRFDPPRTILLPAVTLAASATVGPTVSAAALAAMVLAVTSIALPRTVHAQSAPAAGAIDRAGQALAERFAGASQAAPTAPTTKTAPTMKTAPIRKTATGDAAAAPASSDEAEMLARAREEVEALHRGADEAPIRDRDGSREAAPVPAAVSQRSDAARQDASGELAPVGAITAAPTPTAAPVAPSAASPAVRTRVTLLLVMEPGHTGIRRFNRFADPVLCLADTCYVSRGPMLDAVALPSWRVFGPANTLGERAGACNNQLGCVFRNVDLGGPAAIVQPVDLRILHHDRREPSAVPADMGCSVGAAGLSCATTTRGPDYRIWAVPESLSGKAGPVALSAALDGGLAAAN